MGMNAGSSNDLNVSVIWKTPDQTEADGMFVFVLLIHDKLGGVHRTLVFSDLVLPAAVRQSVPMCVQVRRLTLRLN